ncbi:hypothetical protein B0H14DRAFT_2583659 [Mycena olivaceomarginata]|nr:hypothetical protein B0H14DRAFT_2583659 [Mycena olivaceomarginata]
MSLHKSPNPFPLVKNSGPPPPDYSSCRPIEYLGQNFRGYTTHDQHQGRYYWLVYLQGNLGGEQHDVRLRTMTPVDESRRVDDSATRADESTTPAHAHTSSTTRAQANDMTRPGASLMTRTQANYHVVRLRAMTPVLSAQASTRLIDDSRAGELHVIRLRAMTPVLSAQASTRLVDERVRLRAMTSCHRCLHGRAHASWTTRAQPAQGVHTHSLYGVCDDSSTPVVFFLLLLSIFVALLTEQYRAHAEENLHGRNVEKCLQAFDTHADALAMWAKVCHSVHRRCKSHNACEGHGCDLKADHLQRATEAAAAATRAALNASRAADALTSAVRASSRSTTSSSARSARSAATTPDPPRPPALIPGSRPGTVRRGKWMSKYPPRGRMTPLPTPDPERERNPSPHPPLYDDDSDNDTTTLPTPLAGNTTAPTARSAFTAPATPRNTTIKREKSAATVSLWADGDDTECEGAGSDDAAMVVDSSPRSSQHRTTPN